MCESSVSQSEAQSPARSTFSTLLVYAKIPLAIASTLAPPLQEWQMGLLSSLVTDSFVSPANRLSPRALFVQTIFDSLALPVAPLPISLPLTSPLSSLCYYQPSHLARLSVRLFDGEQFSRKA